MGKEEKIIKVMAPFTGKVKPLSKTPEKKYADGLMGEGLVIEPEEGIAVAPYDGEITQLIPQENGFTVRHESGIEAFVQVGTGAKGLEGDYFKKSHNENEKVKKGKPVLEFNLEKVKVKAPSLLSPVIITNYAEAESIVKTDASHVNAGQDVLLEIHLKVDDDDS